MTAPTTRPRPTQGHLPSRDDHGTTPVLPAQPDGRTCPVCAGAFTPTGRQRFCSTRCRKVAFRRRRSAADPVAVPPAGGRREHTIYECGTCGTRQLGQQRCQDCGTFSTSLGLGGNCPCCNEPITLTDLDLTT